LRHHRDAFAMLTPAAALLLAVLALTPTRTFAHSASETTSTSGSSRLSNDFANLNPAPEPPSFASTPDQAASVSSASSATTSDVDLTKKLSDLVASLISVLIQFNYDTGYGPKDTERVTANIQPVIPISVNEDWNLIVRTIVSIVYQGSLADSIDSEFGLGDTVQRFFFSPKEPASGVILAAGPAALWPTGTKPLIRPEQFGLGLTVLALRQDKGWTYGVLASHVSGVTESDDHPDINATFLQPLVSYTWPSATSLTFNTESNYDWTAEEWIILFNVIVGQLVKIGKQPVQFFKGRSGRASSEDWWELFVGPRVAVDITENWSLSLRADFGGFGIFDADLSWQVVDLAACHWRFEK